MVIEIGYVIKYKNIYFDLLLLFLDILMECIYFRLVDIEE